jgi:hypothetical protein
VWEEEPYTICLLARKAHCMLESFERRIEESPELRASKRAFWKRLRRAGFNGWIILLPSPGGLGKSQGWPLRIGAPDHDRKHFDALSPC